MEQECEIGWRGMGVIVREVERLLGLVLDACSNVCAIERERERERELGTCAQKCVGKRKREIEKEESSCENECFWATERVSVCV